MGIAECRGLRILYIWTNRRLFSNSIPAVNLPHRISITHMVRMQWGSVAAEFRKQAHPPLRPRVLRLCGPYVLFLLVSRMKVPFNNTMGIRIPYVPVVGITLCRDGFSKEASAKPSRHPWAEMQNHVDVPNIRERY